MVGIGQFACEEECCGEGGDPGPCETVCCNPYPNALAIWAILSANTAIPGMDCEVCSESLPAPFKITLEKDAEYAPPESFPDCDFADQFFCYSPLVECASESPCINASYRAMISTGCKCCTNTDPELGPPTYCSRIDYYIWAHYFTISLYVGEVMNMPCTVYFEIFEIHYYGPDCDHLAPGVYYKTGYFAIVDPEGNACSCGTYDIADYYGYEDGFCGEQPINTLPICTFSFFPESEEHPEYGQLEVCVDD